MPGITNPAEEYFKDGLWGWATNIWEKLISSGGILYNALHGWDGDSWQKLPMVWGYSGQRVQSVSSLTGAAGIRTLTCADVDAGEVWVLQAADARNLNTDPSLVQLRAVTGGKTIRLEEVTTPGVGGFLMWQGHIALAEDGFVSVRFEDCALDDDVYLTVLGYKMKIAE